MIKRGWHQTLAKGARPECFRHWRLWAGFGDWEGTKVKDVVFESLFCKIYRRAKMARLDRKWAFLRPFAFRALAGTANNRRRMGGRFRARRKAVLDVRGN